ncbi:hypothetical protein H4R33_003815 [Dimargaris cristalligena]|nr:hypothetical protein H4R33_003815 [Dimargaris cristalligena]
MKLSDTHFLSLTTLGLSFWLEAQTALSAPANGVNHLEKLPSEVLYNVINDVYFETRDALAQTSTILSAAVNKHPYEQTIGKYMAMCKGLALSEANKPLVEGLERPEQIWQQLIHQPLFTTLFVNSYSNQGDMLQYMSDSTRQTEENKRWSEIYDYYAYLKDNRDDPIFQKDAWRFIDLTSLKRPALVPQLPLMAIVDDLVDPMHILQVLDVLTGPGMHDLGQEGMEHTEWNRIANLGRSKVNGLRVDLHIAKLSLEVFNTLVNLILVRLATTGRFNDMEAFVLNLKPSVEAHHSGNHIQSDYAYQKTNRFAIVLAAMFGETHALGTFTGVFDLLLNFFSENRRLANQCPLVYEMQAYGLDHGAEYLASVWGCPLTHGEFVRVTEVAPIIENLAEVAHADDQEDDDGLNDWDQGLTIDFVIPNYLHLQNNGQIGILIPISGFNEQDKACLPDLGPQKPDAFDVNLFARQLNPENFESLQHLVSLGFQRFGDQGYERVSIQNLTANN